MNTRKVSAAVVSVDKALSDLSSADPQADWDERLSATITKLADVRGDLYRLRADYVYEHSREKARDTARGKRERKG